MFVWPTQFMRNVKLHKKPDRRYRKKKTVTTRTMKRKSRKENKDQQKKI